MQKYQYNPVTGVVTHIQTGQAVATFNAGLYYFRTMHGYGVHGVLNPIAALELAFELFGSGDFNNRDAMYRMLNHAIKTDESKTYALTLNLAEIATGICGGNFNAVAVQWFELAKSAQKKDLEKELEDLQKLEEEMAETAANMAGSVGFDMEAVDAIKKSIEEDVWPPCRSGTSEVEIVETVDAAGADFAQTVMLNGGENPLSLRELHNRAHPELTPVAEGKALAVPPRKLTE